MPRWATPLRCSASPPRCSWPRGTFLLAEAAQTDGDSLARGGASRLELRHRSTRVEGARLRRSLRLGLRQPLLHLPGGCTELGGRGTYTLDPRTRVMAEALRTADNVTGGRRDGVMLGVERAFYQRLRVEAGFRHASETTTPTTATTLGATPNATNALRTRITAEIAKERRASVWGEFEQDIQEADQRRAALGADLLVAKRTRLYGRHEFLSSFAGPYAAQRRAGHRADGVRHRHRLSRRQPGLSPSIARAMPSAVTPRRPSGSGTVGPSRRASSSTPPSSAWSA